MGLELVYLTATYRTGHGTKPLDWTVSQAGVGHLLVLVDLTIEKKTLGYCICVCTKSILNYSAVLPNSGAGPNVPGNQSGEKL